MNLNDQLLEGSTDLYRIINSGPTELRGSGHKLMNINDPPGPTDLRGSGHKLMNLNAQLRSNGSTQVRTQVDVQLDSKKCTGQAK